MLKPSKTFIINLFLFLFSQSNQGPGISLCSLPRLSLQDRGLFLVRWHYKDTTPDPGIANPKYVMEASRSAGALKNDVMLHKLFVNRPSSKLPPKLDRTSLECFHL